MVRTRSLRRFDRVWSAHETVGIQTLVIVTAITTELFKTSLTSGVIWLTDLFPVDRSNAAISPEQLSGDYTPWFGLLGWLPILPTLLVACVIWSILVWRNRCSVHHGHALVLGMYGFFCRSFGEIAVYFTEELARVGRVLLFAGDLAVLLGLTVWATMTVATLRARPRRLA